MKLYFIGICGTAMGNVAVMLKKMGHEVAGSDAHIYPPISDLLEAEGIEAFQVDDEKRLVEFNPDCVIVGNAISRGNPELEYLLSSRSYRYTSLPEFIKESVLKDRFNIVVTGTHGKTTTTSLAAYLLKEAGRDPGYMIGGVPKDFSSGCCSGSKSDPFVIEGDEYDSAFFDKRSKFVHYLPSILIINNIEFDHADIFRDLEDIQRSFRNLLKVVPSNGIILVNGDDEAIADLLPVNWGVTYKVGVGEGNDLRIENFSEDASGAQFDLVWKGKEWASVEWASSGLYNARNSAMAALSVGLSINREDPTVFDARLAKGFLGVKRRQEILYQSDDEVVIEDFAHHPTAIRLALKGFREKYPEHRIVACFEPRSNTSCRNIHQNDYVEAFSFADAVKLGPIYREEKYSEDDKIDRARICEGLSGKEIEAGYFDEYDSLLGSLTESCSGSERRIVCFFSNGSFGDLMTRYVDSLNATFQYI